MNIKINSCTKQLVNTDNNHVYIHIKKYLKIFSTFCTTLLQISKTSFTTVETLYTFLFKRRYLYIVLYIYLIFQDTIAITSFKYI